MLAIRDVVEAHGGMSVVSSKMHVNRESFYKSLSGEERCPIFNDRACC